MSASVVILLFLVAAANAATTPMTTTHVAHHSHHGHHTHGPRPTHESSESERFQFSYDPSSHRILVYTGPGGSCYLYHPTDLELMSIHDMHAFRTMETSLIQKIDSGMSMTTMLKDDLGLYSKIYARTCTHVANVYSVS